ncbi:MAG: multiheme c-type cytochrome [bacterium]
MARCRECHAREYANWLSGGHSATYADIFLDEKHNREERLSESCLRCHGMFFEGTISDVVTSLDVRGPWQLIDAELASVPTIPCMACHNIHIEGSPAVRPDHSDPATIAASRETRTAKVGFYDRYEKMHFVASELPVLQLSHNSRNVQVATDERQRVCIQCHAPNAFHQAGSSDDRTPRGVHEGLSCGA